MHTPTGPPTTEAAIEWAAQLIIWRHEYGGRCDHCPTEGLCRRLVEARLDLARIGLPHPQY